MALLFLITLLRQILMMLVKLPKQIDIQVLITKSKEVTMVESEDNNILTPKQITKTIWI